MGEVRNRLWMPRGARAKSARKGLSSSRVTTSPPGRSGGRRSGRSSMRSRPFRPMIVRRVCGHIAVANRAALAAHPGAHVRRGSLLRPPRGRRRLPARDGLLSPEPRRRPGRRSCWERRGRSRSGSRRCTRSAIPPSRRRIGRSRGRGRSAFACSSTRSRRPRRRRGSGIPRNRRLPRGRREGLSRRVDRGAHGRCSRAVPGGRDRTPSP